MSSRESLGDRGIWHAARTRLAKRAQIAARFFSRLGSLRMTQYLNSEIRIPKSEIKLSPDIVTSKGIRKTVELWLGENLEHLLGQLEIVAGRDFKIQR